MKVIVGFEFSQIVTKAFRNQGHEAYSCDLLPTEGNPDWHIQDDVFKHLDENWDIGIFHPPCTHLAVSGARWFAGKEKERWEAIKFFMEIALCEIPKIAIENPIGIMSTVYRKPDQIIQPWQFGHGETKATCLWLKGVPKLRPTNIVEGREQRIHKMPPSKERGKERSRTFAGIGKAMAEQWG